MLYTWREIFFHILCLVTFTNDVHDVCIKEKCVGYHGNLFLDLSGDDGLFVSWTDFLQLSDQKVRL